MPFKKTNTYRTSSSEETKRIGEEFAARLLGGKNASNITTVVARKNAVVIILSGELGAGKTTFVQGFLKGAGVRGHASSPTFVIMRHYRVPGMTKKNLSTIGNAANSFTDIFHMDAYRLQPAATKNAAHLAALDFNELVENTHNIVLIEWGERIERAIPKDALRVKFRYDKKEGTRVITVLL